MASRNRRQPTGVPSSPTGRSICPVVLGLAGAWIVENRPATGRRRLPHGRVARRANRPGPGRRRFFDTDEFETARARLLKKGNAMNLLMRTFFPMFLCGSIGLILFGQLRPDGNLTMPQWQLREEAPVQVTVAEATLGDLRHVVEANGKIEAEVEVKISAEVSGRIADLTVREGDTVRSNQLLLQLDLAIFEADLTSTQARVQRLNESILVSEADGEKAQRDFERFKQLYAKQVVARSEYDDAATLYKKEKARLNMTKQELVEAESAFSKAKEDLRKATIRSPLSGVISQLTAKQGEVVLVGTMNNPGTVIMTLSDPNRLVVR